MVVGSTSGGEFVDRAEVPDGVDVGRFAEQWRARGYLAERQLDPPDQAQVVVDVIGSRSQIDVVWARPLGVFQLPDGGG